MLKLAVVVGEGVGLWVTVGVSEPVGDVLMLQLAVGTGGALSERVNDGVGVGSITAVGVRDVDALLLVLLLTLLLALMLGLMLALLLGLTLRVLDVVSCGDLVAVASTVLDCVGSMVKLDVGLELDERVPVARADSVGKDEECVLEKCSDAEGLTWADCVSRLLGLEVELTLDKGVFVADTDSVYDEERELEKSGDAEVLGDADRSADRLAVG